MKILVANLGSTSLKWRLFDFANGQEAMLHKGGFERVTDYPKAIDDCLGQIKEAGHIKSEKDLETYISHPDHKAFGAVVRPVVEDVFVIDFWSKD